jgi:hypothetical protein
MSTNNRTKTPKFGNAEDALDEDSDNDFSGYASSSLIIPWFIIVWLTNREILRPRIIGIIKKSKLKSTVDAGAGNTLVAPQGINVCHILIKAS